MSDGSFDSARFRQVLGHFPTGVVVVASLYDGEPVGMAIGSFFSISLDPALVGFCIDHRSSTWPKVQKTGRFSVNLLAEDQESVARTFASRSDDKFAGLGWDHSPLGSPRLRDTLGWIDCEIDAVHAAGDHDLVVGRVEDLALTNEGRPLIFFRGGYSGLA